MSISSTAQALGQTTFSSLISGSNLTATLESTQFATVFLPSNAAFAAASVGTSISSSTASLLSNHVVGGFAGYLPVLKDGAALTTQKGETLIISIRNGIYYVNDAKITQANIITENGVVHIIDKVSLQLVPIVYSTYVLTHSSSSIGAIDFVTTTNFFRWHAVQDNQPYVCDWSCCWGSDGSALILRYNLGRRLTRLE